MDKMGPLISREEFYSGLDYTIPGLAAVKKSVDAANYSAASRALLDYMRSRANVKYFTMASEKPTQETPDADTSMADDFINHLFHWGITDQYPPFQLGEKIDWAANPYNDREWAWVANRHAHWTLYAKAYWATLDEKYARAFVDELTDWITTRPVITDGTHNFSASWRTIEAGIRMHSSWPACYQYFINSPNFTPQVNELYLRSLVDHARHLEKNPTGNNWLTMETNGLLHISVLFPEFGESAKWRKLALDRFTAEAGKQVYPDGLQVELSTGYHRGVIYNFTGPLRLCEINGIEVPTAFKTGLEKLDEADMYLCKPNGYLPALNDADARVDGVPESGKWSLAVEDLTDAAKRYGRKDMLYVATNGKQGTAPKDTSHAFPYGGLYVMREGWGKDSLYLCFDAGPFGAGHQHEDKLSFEAYGYGETLLFDPGRYAYADSIYRTYFVTTASHNTALVDGKRQARAYQKPEDRRWVATGPSSNPWVSSSDFDYAEGIYDDGYGPEMDKSVTHRRAVLFVKNDYWIVVDRFDGSGDHTINTLFHFAPGKLSLDEKSLTCASTNPGRPNMLVAPSDTRSVKVSIIEGSDSPCQGWISTDYNCKVPAPVADFEYRGQLPGEFAYILYPSRPSQQGTASIERVNLTVDGHAATSSACAYKATLNDGTIDYILLAYGIRGEKRFCGITTSAQISITRTDRFGKILKSTEFGE